MSVSDELYSKLNTLPWQALFEYSKRKGIKEEEIKNVLNPKSWTV